MEGGEQRRVRAEAEVARLQAALPSPVRLLAERVPVLFHDWPPEDAPGEDLLGLFVGYDYGGEGEGVDPAVTRIELYLENLWNSVEGDPEDFVEEVGITYLHELGHYLGWDEDDLEVRGLD